MWKFSGICLRTVENSKLIIPSPQDMYNESRNLVKFIKIKICIKNFIKNRKKCTMKAEIW